MRPATRTTLAIVLATTLAVGLLAWLAYAPEPAPEPAVVEPAVPQDAAPRPEGVMGDPGPEGRAEMLDRIERMEAERFGDEEARSRRRVRQQMLEDRLKEHHD